MKKSKSFDNLLTDLHSDLLPESPMPTLPLPSEGVAELSPLSSHEADQLAHYEQLIREGLTTFLTVGNALMEIRQHKLYRATHRTFESYCRERFQLKRQRAYELIGAAEVVNSLSDKTILSDFSDKAATQPLPERESHASALTELPPVRRRAVWREVTQRAERAERPITASLIKQVITESNQKQTKGESLSAEQNIFVNSVEQDQFLKKVKRALNKAEPTEISLKVSGSWLIKNNLIEAWRAVRNRPDWVINDKFEDTLTLAEARLLGMIR